MSLLWRRSVEEKRALSFQDVWGAGGTPDTTAGSVEGGLRLVPVYAATSLIADLVSTTKLQAYREMPDSTCVPVPRQPQLFTNPSPLPRFTSVDWLHQAVASLLLRGNAIGYTMAVDNSGTPSQVVWLHPDQVGIIEDPMRMDARPKYYWRGQELDLSLVVHIPAYTFPGSCIGYSPLRLFMTQVRLGLQASQWGLDWFDNGTAPSGQLRNISKTITSGEADVVKSRFKASVRRGDPFVTGSDWEWSQLSVKADEAQFLQTIKANATQIASIYRVSPEDIGGEVANSLTYKTLEQDNTKLTQRTLRVWCARLEAHLSQMLPNKQEARFDLAALARGDLTSQMIAHTAALNAGLETNTEGRQELGRPPLTPEEVAEWQANYRTSSPVMTGVPATDTPAPRPGITGGPNA